MTDALKHLRPRVWAIVKRADGLKVYKGTFAMLGTPESERYAQVHDSAYVELLERIVERQSEALATLKVAVNDKVEDKGATAFIARTESAVQQMCEEFGRE